MRMKKSMLKVVIAVLMMGGITAQAVDRTWSGGAIGTGWNESSNWLPFGVPSSPSDTAIFDASSTIKLDPIDLAGISDLADVQLTAPVGNVGLAFSSSLNIGNVDMSSATKDLTLTGTGSSMWIKHSTDSTVTIDVASGRTLTVSGLPQTLMDDKILDLPGAGTVNFVNGAFDMGRESSASPTVETTVNISAGTWKLDGSDIRMWWGTNTVNQTGGTVEMLENLTMAINVATNYANTYNLDAGILKALRVKTFGSSGGTTAFVFNGGTFQVKGASGEFNANLSEVRIDAGGAVFDTDGNTLSMYKGITGIGTLTKNGLGDMWLNETNNYGDTVVNGGRLLANEPGALGFDQVRTVTVGAGARVVFTAVASNHDLLDVIVDSAGLIEVSAGATNSINRLSLDGGVSQMPAGVYGDETTGFIGDGYIRVRDIEDSSAIFSFSSVSNDIMKVEFMTLESPDLHYLKTQTDLVFGTWTNAAISDDGLNAFVVTNLGYSTTEGTTNVVYVKAIEDDQEFFGIGKE